jgi:drug/metabolite transporter (DMT)-like permease
MGVALALLAMLCFASNILMSRRALAYMPVESGFLVVLATNVLFPAALFGVQMGLRPAPPVWDSRGLALFAAGGIVGTFVGRRMLFDAVRLLGPSRTSVFHSSAPAFALLGAWVFAGESLGLYEIVLVAMIWTGLWMTQPPAAARAAEARAEPGKFRKGLIAGILAVVGFGFGNVLRGLAIRGWSEAVLGTVISSAAALALQLAVTRDWRKVGAQMRSGGARALVLYIACGIATSFGSVFVTLAMERIKIGLAVLMVHSTPLVIFPVSAFLLKHRELINARALAGTGLVLTGVAALAFR